MTSGDPCSLRSGNLAVEDRASDVLSSLLVNYSTPIQLGVCRGRLTANRHQDSYLVDSASSHMLVSKIKPCMSKYKQLVL